MNDKQARLLNAKMAHYDMPARAAGAGFGPTGTLRPTQQTVTLTDAQQARLAAILADTGESVGEWVERHLAQDELHTKD